MILENEALLHPIREERMPVRSENKVSKAETPQEDISKKYEQAIQRLNGIVDRLNDNDGQKGFDLAIKIDEIHALSGATIGVALLVASRNKDKKANWLQELENHLETPSQTEFVKKIVEIDQQLEVNGIYAL